MKSAKTLIAVITISFSCILNAQDSKVETQNSIDKKSYYQKRAEEDAKFEQQFSAKTKAEEETFWNEQKNYENELKQNDKKAYKAYMKGKRDAYASHYNECNHHCHHNDYYYHHASFYHYRYNEDYYRRYPSNRSTISTNVRVQTPSVRLGLF